MRRALTGIVAAATLAGGLAAAPASATHVAMPPDCPEVMPTEQVRRGMTGIGWTVAEERRREHFDVEVLGVMESVFPGRDLIVIEATGDVITRGGGIWYGMSGSPVYVDGKLIGAVAFGLTWGPSNIGALTPAEEMMRVLEYPNEDAGAQRSTYGGNVEPSDTMRRQIASETGSSSMGSFTQLRVPVSVSGGSHRLVQKLQTVAERERLPIVPFAGAAASADATAAAALQVHAGDNLVATMSYGDITFAGIGTVTFVCDGRVMSFGHPFFWEGDTTLGANAADTITVVKDPFFTYELATVAEGIGTIDQDRFAGLRARSGDLPDTIPVTSSVQALNVGRSRDGQTNVVISEIVPFLAWAHVYDNILFTMDEYSGGSSSLTWTIQGVTSSGEPFTLTRSNRYASRYGIAGRSSYELSGQLFTLFRNRFEEVEFTSVDVDAAVDDEIERYTIKDVLVSKDGTTFTERRRIRSRPGRTIYLRVDLEEYEGTETRSVDLEVTVPVDARRDGVIEISSGLRRGGEICLYRPRRCVDATGQKVDSFAALVAALQDLPRNDELMARLRMGRRMRIVGQDEALLDRVVSGNKSIYVSIPGGCCASGGEEGKTAPGH